MPFIFPEYGSPLYNYAIANGAAVEQVDFDDPIRDLLPQIIPDIQNPPVWDEDLFAGYKFFEVRSVNRLGIEWHIARTMLHSRRDPIMPRVVAVFVSSCDRSLSNNQHEYLKQIFPRTLSVNLVCEDETRVIQMNETIYRLFSKNMPDDAPTIMLLFQSIYDDRNENLEFAFFWAEILIDLLHAPTSQTLNTIPSYRLANATDGVHSALNVIVPEFFDYPEHLIILVHNIIQSCARMSNQRVMQMGAMIRDA